MNIKRILALAILAYIILGLLLPGAILVIFLLVLAVARNDATSENAQALVVLFVLA
jgi:hypothetical protein